MTGTTARRVSASRSLDDIAADPTAVEELTDAEVATLLMRALAVQGTLQARVMHRAVVDAAVLRDRERLLTTAEVARKLGRSVSWVEKNLNILPRRRSLGGSPVWREGDVDEWIRSAPKY